MKSKITFLSTLAAAVTALLNVHAESADSPVPLYVNQSGYDLGWPKRFTAPTLPDGTRFVVRKKDGGSALFAGTIAGNRGDFSAFEPADPGEYVVEAEGLVSVPFSIAPWWIERVTYQNAVDFMIESRNHLGTHKLPRPLSYGWRDDHAFAFEVNTLVAQYFSNPDAYRRMPHQITYEKPAPEQVAFWGALEPYQEGAPDIVKLIHWGTDVIVTQNLTHELFKEQAAWFLYAWPQLKEWIPEAAYRTALRFALDNWGENTIALKYPYNGSRGHDLFALKNRHGGTKGELPPGHSLQPNLFMYEVAKREKLPGVEKFFDAAYRQCEWQIQNLDWNDPLVTKGQRMSEHITIPGMVYFLQTYPDRAPKGLREKIEEWAAVAVRRSQNLWDFRKLDDGDGWVPKGEAKNMWNEPGNVAGFPACALAAAEVVPDPELRRQLVILAAAHLDDVFGRNPLGRHFSHDAAKEIEGVERGWPTEYPGGNGMLQPVRFVLDGAPKQEHYPYHPEAGPGYTEGWVNFNTAYNASLAWMAYARTSVALFDAGFAKPLATLSPGETLGIELIAPINFDYARTEEAAVRVAASSGD
ncbi:MAG TPA: hypothetical protein VIS74_03235, partial [Chthoniobacterales bacterium]